MYARSEAIILSKNGVSVGYGRQQRWAVVVVVVATAHHQRVAAAFGSLHNKGASCGVMDTRFAMPFWGLCDRVLLAPGLVGSGYVTARRKPPTLLCAAAAR